MKMKMCCLLVAGMVVANLALANGPVEKIESSFPVRSTSSQPESGLLKPVPAINVTQIAEFEIRKGEKMRDAMERWTRMVGHTLVWQPEPEEGDIQFAASMTFRDTFSEASRQFFDIVKNQSKFDGQFHENGVLRVFVANQNR